MNRIFLIFIIAFATVISFTSCDREAMVFGSQTENPTTNGQGQLNLSSLKIGVNAAESEVQTRGGVDVTNFIVKLYDENKVTLLKEWKYSEMPEVFALNVGTYEIDVLSHEVNEAEWEKPYYYATQKFDISADTFTDLGTITCRLNNVKVTIEYDDELKAVMGNDINVAVSLNQNTKLDFNQTETRAGYFKTQNAENNVLYTSFKGTIAGEMYEVNNSFSGVKAGEYRRVVYSLKSSIGDIDEGGVPTFIISVDVTCFVVDMTVDVDPGADEGIDDFPVAPDPVDPVDPVDPTDPEPTDPEPTDPENAPSIVGTSFYGAPFDIDQSLIIPGQCELIVTLFAPDKIANVEVTIDSDTLTPDILGEVGLTDEFDLAYPGDYATGLSGLGFPVGDDVIGQTELLFDISQFTELLGIYGAATHHFIIKVTDQKGASVTKTLTLISE